MDYKELKNKSATELLKLLSETRVELQKMRFQMSTKRLTSVRKVREARKLIAQILTILNKINK